MFCGDILLPVLMGSEEKLTSVLRETPRDSVLLPQEHKRQTREKVFGSAESYAKIRRNIQYINEHHTWVISRVHHH